MTGSQPGMCLRRSPQGLEVHSVVLGLHRDKKILPEFRPPTGVQVLRHEGQVPGGFQSLDTKKRDPGLPSYVLFLGA